MTRINDAFAAAIDDDEDAAPIALPSSDNIDRDLRAAVAQAIPLARALQYQRDEALLAAASAADENNPIMQGLRALSERNRLQRSLDIINEQIIPHLDQRVAVVVRQLDETLFK